MMKFKLTLIILLVYTSLSAQFGLWTAPGFYEDQRRNGTGLSISFGFRERLFKYAGIGMEFGIIDNQDIDPQDVFNYGYYHNPYDFDWVGKKYVGPQWGFDLLIFANPSPYISLYTGGGLYFQRYGEMYFNQWYGSYYPQGGNLTYQVEKAYSGGMHINLPVNRFIQVILGGGYHSVRGGQLILGFSV